MRKILVACLLSICLVVGAAIAISLFFSKPLQFTEEERRQIFHGITDNEVAMILGCPPDRCVDGKDHVGFGTRCMAARDLSDCRIMTWNRGECSVIVAFAPDGTAVEISHGYVIEKSYWNW
jgi:hypothetical protein